MNTRFFIALLLVLSLALSGCSDSKPKNTTVAPGWTSHTTVGKAQLALPESAYELEPIEKNSKEGNFELQYLKPLDEKSPKIIALSMTPPLWLRGLLVFFEVTDECFQSGFISSYKSSLTNAVIAKEHPDAKITWRRDSSVKINNRETLHLEGTMVSSKLPKPLTHEHYIWKENGDIFVLAFLYDPTQVPSPKGKIQQMMKSVTHP